MTSQIAGKSQHSRLFSDRKRLFAWCAIGVFLLALLLRLVVCRELAGTPAVCAPAQGTDMATYHRLALEIRNGQWPAFFDYQPFYYTVFLPVAYLFSPKGGVWPVLLLQALLGAATCVLAMNATARLFGRKAGVLTGVLLALSRMHVFYTAFLLLEVCFAFWMALVLYALVRLLQDFRLRWALLTGFACAGALLTRGNALLWVPGVLVLILWRGWKKQVLKTAGDAPESRSWKRLSAVIACFLLAFLLPIAPYSLRNSLATGRLCGASVAGGKVLSLGNSPEAPAGGLEYPRTYYEWNDDEAAGRGSVVSHIVQWACQEPAAFLELKARTLLLFWDKTEIPNNVSWEVDGRMRSQFLRMPILLPGWLLGTLGLAGLFLLCGASRRLSRIALLWLMAAFWGATSAFYLLARFRIAALPLLCCLAGGFLAEALRRLREERKRVSATTPPSAEKKPAAHGLSAVLLAGLCALFVVCFAHDLYCDYAMPGVFRALRPEGLQLHFEKEEVIYDHGPLGFGGSAFYELQGRDAMLEKTFCIPEKILADAERSHSCRLLVRMMSTHASNLTAWYPYPVLTVNGKRVRSDWRWGSDRNAQWLEITFKSRLQRETTLAISLSRPPEIAEVYAVVIDTQRNYGRTRLDGKDVPAELVAELVLLPEP